MSKKEVIANIDKYLARLEISEYRNRKLETLSKGNQQKVQLAQTLVANPDIVIFDEPFSGLDPVNAKLLKDVVNDCIQERKLVIFSSHQMSYVEEFCENIVIIHHGEVVLEGNLQKIKEDFGQGRLYLETTAPKEKVAQLTSVEEVVSHQDGYILNPKDNMALEDVLQEILQQKIAIRQFGLYEPTLTEIFVQKAGDES